MPLPDLVWLPVAFFVVALLYASVGFGGGLSYLALLSLVLTDLATIRTVALLCNVVVVAGNCYTYWRAGSLNLQKALPFVLLSVPAAFLGGTLRLTETAFFVTLGGVLISAALLLVAQSSRRSPTTPAVRLLPLVSSALGGGIGLLSGMVGIGGGILLSPVLHLLRWGTAARIAALASVFILVNSLAGLAGLAASGSLGASGWLPGALVGAVLVGGLLGSRMGLTVLGPRWMKRATAALVLYVGIRLVLRYGLGVA